MATDKNAGAYFQLFFSWKRKEPEFQNVARLSRDNRVESDQIILPQTDIFVLMMKLGI